MSKRGRTILFIILFIILIGLIALFFITKKSENNTQNNFEKEINENSNINPENFDYENSDSGINTETVTSGGSSGSSGGESSTSTSLCPTQEISYSVLNVNKTQICNSYFGEICVDKTITCKAEIFNREEIAGGEFELQLDFLENAGIVIIDTKNLNIYLEPKQTKIFQDSTNVQSQGEDGIANQNINCFFKTLKVPLKEVC